jgi:hypothetical protein
MWRIDDMCEESHRGVRSGGEKGEIYRKGDIGRVVRIRGKEER